jgi:hypothetical protein
MGSRTAWIDAIPEIAYAAHGQKESIHQLLVGAFTHRAGVVP